MNSPPDLLFVTNLLGAVIRIEEDVRGRDSTAPVWLLVGRGAVRGITITQYGPQFWVASPDGAVELLYLDVGGRTRRLIIEQEPEQ